jgi:hypothetical protein
MMIPLSDGVGFELCDQRYNGCAVSFIQGEGWRRVAGPVVVEHVGYLAKL